MLLLPSQSHEVAEVVGRCLQAATICTPHLRITLRLMGWESTASGKNRLHMNWDLCIGTQCLLK